MGEKFHSNDLFADSSLKFLGFFFFLFLLLLYCYKLFYCSPEAIKLFTKYHENELQKFYGMFSILPKHYIIKIWMKKLVRIGRKLT